MEARIAYLEEQNSDIIKTTHSLKKDFESLLTDFENKRVSITNEGFY